MGPPHERPADTPVGSRPVQPGSVGVTSSEMGCPGEEPQVLIFVNHWGGWRIGWEGEMNGIDSQEWFLDLAWTSRDKTGFNISI